MTPQSLPRTCRYAERRERLDASILRALGERRLLRLVRSNAPSGDCDLLEQLLARAATLLWETSSATVHLEMLDDLLAWCAFVARELEVTEALDLAAPAERERLRSFAARAIAALDTVAPGLFAPQPKTAPALARALASTFGNLRAALVAASRPPLAQAA
jgi:hypothetical protein